MLCNNVSVKFLFYFVLTFDSWSFKINYRKGIKNALSLLLLFLQLLFFYQG
nr:MAG TPA: hypothetical protein [Caudoviricetes sp.]